MALTVSAYLDGISALGCFVIAGFLGFRFLFRYLREKKGLMPFVSILGFSFIAFYLGPFTTFWSLVFTGNNIDPVLYTQLSYTVTPIAVVNVMWLGFSIFNPDKKRLALYVYSLTAIPFYIFLFGFPSQQISTNAIQPGDMLDTAFSTEVPVLVLILLFYIVSAVFILGGGFYYLRQKIAGIDRQRATYLAYGFFCFGIAGILETAVPSDYVVVARLFMVTFLILTYMGFWTKTPPEIEPRVAIEAPKSMDNEES